jgi:hypothetical protein
VRILENQNRLWISQGLFRYPHFNHGVVSLFKDSITGTAAPSQENYSGFDQRITQEFSLLNDAVRRLSRKEGSEIKAT